MDNLAFDITAIADGIISLFPKEELMSAVERNVYAMYADNPVGFGQDILGEDYTDDIKTLMESVRDNVVTIARSANATGKTHGAARVAVWFYKTHPDCQVYTAAAPPEDNLKRLLWGEIGSLVHKNNSLFKSDVIKDLHIQRNPLEFITGVTIPSSGTSAQKVAKFSGKHAPHLLFILDEGDAIPDAVYEGIESCMSGGTIVRLLIMFNPRSEAGEVWRMEAKGRANVVELSAFNHPNVLTGKNLIPGAVTRETTVSRINDWCRKLTKGEKADEHTFTLPEFLIGSTATMKTGGIYPPLEAGDYKITTPAFSYMVLGKYPSQGANQLISKEWISNARARWDVYTAKFGDKPPAGSSCIMGLDAAEEGVDENIASFRWGGYVEPFVSWSGVDMYETGDKGASEYKKRNAVKCGVDGTGVGAGVAPHMRRKSCNAHSIKVASSPTHKTEMGEFRILRDQLWWAVRDWLKNDPGAMLPPDDMLIEELMCPTYKVNGKYIEVMKKDDMKLVLKRSPDRADGLCLTFAPMPDIKTNVQVKKSNYVW